MSSVYFSRITKLPFLAKSVLKHGPGILPLFRKVKPFTMVSIERLENLYDLSIKAQREQIPGSFVECGVWRGGCVGVMASTARSNGRKIHLFDSFEGLPEPHKDLDGNYAVRYAEGGEKGNLTAIGKCVGPIDDVKKLLFEILKLDPQNFVFHQGWFQETLPIDAPSLGPIAILRVDGDWYESTKVCLDHLYDCVSENGYIIIDDYGFWEGCKKAVDEFIAARGLKVEIKKIDHSGVWFRKPIHNAVQ
jgi:hypothetical protein